jgi:hypothetical protein
MVMPMSARRPADCSRSMRSGIWRSDCSLMPASVTVGYRRCQSRPACRRVVGSRESVVTSAPNADAVGIWVSRVPLSEPSWFCVRLTGSSFAWVGRTGELSEGSTVMTTHAIRSATTGGPVRRCGGHAGVAGLPFCRWLLLTCRGRRSGQPVDGACREAGERGGDLPRPGPALIEAQGLRLRGPRDLVRRAAARRHQERERERP